MPSRLVEGMVSALGGGPPPGYGIAPEEQHFWTDVEFGVHPLTGRMEAIGGLFHRMWKEHVEELQRMKNNGWPHTEISATAKILKKREDEANKKDEELVRQHKETLHSKDKEDIAELYGTTPPSNSFNLSPAPGAEDPIGQPSNESIPRGIFKRPEAGQDLQSHDMGPSGDANPLRRSLRKSPDSPSPQLAPKPQNAKPRSLGMSLNDDHDYRQRLTEFQGKAYSRDATGASIQLNRSIATGRQAGKRGEPGVSRRPFSLPSLPYSYGDMEPQISKETMANHHKNHLGYVERLNEQMRRQGKTEPDLMSLLESKDPKVRNNALGVFNHNLWWESLDPKSMGLRGGTLLDAIREKWGSFAAFRIKFKEIASEVFGSGWVWLVKKGDSLGIQKTEQQDNPITNGYTPLLGLDLWEHAFVESYGPDRDRWIQAFFTLINWPKVQERFDDMADSKEILMKSFVVEEDEDDVSPFAIVEKGDITGGERTLTPDQLKTDREFSFTRKEQGVVGSASTRVADGDDFTGRG